MLTTTILLFLRQVPSRSCKTSPLGLLVMERKFGSSYDDSGVGNRHTRTPATASHSLGMVGAFTS